MARKLGEAFVEIKAKMEGLKSGLDQAKALTSNAVADIAESLGLIEQALGKIRNIGLGLTAGVTVPIAFMGRGFIAAGSAAEELENRFDITFGGMAESVEDWSRRLAFSFGRSESSTKQFVSTMNQMIKTQGLGADATAAMAKELTALTFDTASYFDLRPEEMFRKLQSAMVGMPRPLLDLGISIKAAEVETFALKTGIISLGQELTEAQKTVARFGLLLERVPDQMGDAIRTSGSWANQIVRLRSLTKQFSENIGQAMIPTMGIFLRLLNRTIVPLAILTSEFFKAHPIISGFVLAIIGVVAAIGPMLVLIWASIKLFILWKIHAFALKGILFALRFQIKGVTVANWLMNKSFVFTKAVAAFLHTQFVRLKISLISLSAHFRLTALASISFASIWSAAAGIIAAAAGLVAGAFRLMWAAILGPAGLAIIAITALVFLVEHLFAKKAMKGLTEETNALNKAMKALTGGAAEGDEAGPGRAVSTPVLGNLAGGGEGFSRIFGGLAGSLGLKPKGDQLVASKLDRTNELLGDLVAAGGESLRLD